MTFEYQIFVDGDVGPCGAILRQVESGMLRTRTVFKMGDDAPVYFVDHLVEYSGGVHQWTRFTYECPTAEITRHEGNRAADGSVHIDKEPAPALDGALPAYAEHLVLTHLLTSGGPGAAYTQFAEGAPQDGTESVEIRRDGREPTELADGTTVEADRIVVLIDDQPTNTHWSADGEVVKSDWCGAQSFSAPTIELLLTGQPALDDEVAARIREFAAGDSGNG
ncbi:hypothetical protein [Nocardioides sp. Soil805]|uniref:hypothetical protein n=1 Tax=Nocardioides sp. Soil805 TaxID=1736416 RepID=UPI0007028DBD|nr:hypothetical protein [Nocardioides sp. Soil805]KRF34428.1 hypothetical protein ASG94_17225 [Nocardioides sp. Soil805]